MESHREQVRDLQKGLSAKDPGAQRLHLQDMLRDSGDSNANKLQMITIASEEGGGLAALLLATLGSRLCFTPPPNSPRHGGVEPVQCTNNSRRGADPPWLGRSHLPPRLGGS